jgi:hypothetical protein
VLIDDIYDNVPAQNMTGFKFDDLIELASIGQPYLNKTLCKFPNNDEQSIDNCALLNYASPYFNMQPIKLKPNARENQTYYAMSTRNNNFSNRDQKLVINYIYREPIQDSIQDPLQDSIDSANNTQKAKPIIGYSFLGIIICVVCACIVSYIRKHSITFTKIKKQVRLNFASEI